MQFLYFLRRLFTFDSAPVRFGSVPESSISTPPKDYNSKPTFPDFLTCLILEGSQRRVSVE